MPVKPGGTRRAVFLDRDGTLMEEVHYCNDPAKVHVFPGAASALKKLRSNGWLTVIITNQSGIGRGKITPSQYESVHSALMQQLDQFIDATYFCPDIPSLASKRRKPGTGMIEEAALDLGIDPALSVFVGDKDIDISCGKNAGCAATILVQTGYGAKQGACGADIIARDITEAAELILQKLP